MSSVLGTVSNALLMSIVARSVWCAGFSAFRALCMCCVSVVRNNVVECLALKPCCVGERGMSGMMRFRMSPSRILRGLQRRMVLSRIWMVSGLVLFAEFPDIRDGVVLD